MLRGRGAGGLPRGGCFGLSLSGRANFSTCEAAGLAGGSGAAAMVDGVEGAGGGETIAGVGTRDGACGGGAGRRIKSPASTVATAVASANAKAHPRAAAEARRAGNA